MGIETATLERTNAAQTMVGLLSGQAAVFIRTECYTPRRGQQSTLPLLVKGINIADHRPQHYGKDQLSAQYIPASTGYYADPTCYDVFPHPYNIGVLQIGAQALRVCLADLHGIFGVRGRENKYQQTYLLGSNHALVQEADIFAGYPTTEAMYREVVPAKQQQDSIHFI